MDFTDNPQIALALDYLQNTGKNIFLTGKAGTGKTTFLHYIKKKAFKRMVVVAPTGVAAINAGGMTIHSFFQLSFGPQVPGASEEKNKTYKLRAKKIKLIRSLDLLVIDEISMVRADLLDGIDRVLRRYRDKSKPFGGIQLLMIGDLHQLPPVVKDDEWRLLQAHYPSPYFFHSIALQETGMVSIPLKKIYRQVDEIFIALLNKVRNNQMDEQELQQLNSRYRSELPADEEDYITLTAKNAPAHSINKQKLSALSGKSFVYKASIDGDFPQHAYPTDENLELKIGAQVMFIKNDLQMERRFYNGKIGRVVAMNEEGVRILCQGDSEPIWVENMEWTNVKYDLNKQTKEVVENVVGSFSQLPLKLAWAITIHKSQGLTFERVIIDAANAFAHGQTYVALSRCKSFEGIVLRSELAFASVKTDTLVKQHSEAAENNFPKKEDLQQAKREYQQSLILDLFDFKKIRIQFNILERLFLEHNLTISEKALQNFLDTQNKVEKDLVAVAKKFIPQLQGYFQQPPMPQDNTELQNRLRKAAAYFYPRLRACWDFVFGD
ncbi:MAG TPA: helicase [Phaeodactylibacter sp.]|nr:helicase [Phaeodactylibacter sp.]